MRAVLPYPARPLSWLTALVILLVLAGCAGRIETGIVVQPDGAWTGEARFSLASSPALELGWQEDLDARVQDQMADLMGSRGIDYTLSEVTREGGSVDYTVQLQGQDLVALADILSETAAATEGLAGPVALELQGVVQAGQTFEVALPGNPSTGYAWEVDPGQGAAVTQVGGVTSQQLAAGPGSLARQVIRFRSAETGPATLRLAYRRWWEADAVPTRVFSVQSTGLGLAAILADLSMTEPEVTPESEVPAPSPGLAPSAVAPNLPTSYNWCDLGGCTTVKNQGSCGSCWAFATVGVLESALKIEEGLTTNLSEQYLLSCNTDGFDCSGGWWVHDYHQWKYSSPETMAGAVLESAFPYVASRVSCGGPYSHPYRIAAWHYVGSSSGVPATSVIKQAIYDYGPVSVAICIGDAFQHYPGGVFATNETCTGTVNHAVVLVGWNDSEQTWIVRNSWGSGWGEGGYMRIRRGISNVGFGASYIVYISPEPMDNWVYLPVVSRD